ncbi:MAG: AAA family ATPase [candidate division Zixibacteria bacterium]|nr:AAA family ATPase [candidate division Zixibacteria bacterium]
MMKIVITGAPGSGKTEFIERLKLLPEFEDVVFFDELARRLLIKKPEYRANLKEFHKRIYAEQVRREDAVSGRPFISDRGTIDAFAFHPETLAFVGTTLQREYRRYTGVIHLGSAASLGERYYIKDAVRLESISDALEIEQAIRSAWQGNNSGGNATGGHPRYQFVGAKLDFEEKYKEFMETLATFDTSQRR